METDFLIVIQRRIRGGILTSITDPREGRLLQNTRGVSLSIFHPMVVVRMQRMINSFLLLLLINAPLGSRITVMRKIPSPLDYWAVKRPKLKGSE